MSKPPKWVELTAYARQHGIPPRTLRHRLAGLHERYGNVLHATNPPGTKVRRWWFDPTVLQAKPSPAQAELADQEHALRRLEAEVNRLRDELLRARRRIKRLGG